MLLQDFTDIQKEFIINEVYPSLKQALLNVSSGHAFFILKKKSRFIWFYYTWFNE